MKQLLVLLIITFLVLTAQGQYPFEKYPTPNYKEYNDWKIYEREKENKVHSTLTIPRFFNSSDNLTIQLTSFTDHWMENSIIRIFNNQSQIQKILENMAFSPTGIDTVRVADINGDGLSDIKIVFPYMGCGLAGLNVRVIYLFQKPDNTFIKISFDDKMNPTRMERDMNGDGNFEIITMTLVGYQEHNYWVFNAFDFSNEQLLNVNSTYDYPILVQYLFRDNYEITKKISRDKMKEFALKTPEGYDKK